MKIKLIASILLLCIFSLRLFGEQTDKSGRLKSSGNNSGPDVLLWKMDIGKNLAPAEFIIANSKVFVGNDEGTMYAISLKTGKKIWEFEAGGAIYMRPVYKEGVIYFTSYNGYLFAVKEETGKEKWRFNAGKDLKAIPFIENNTIYINNKRNIYKLDIETGLELLSKQVKFNIGSNIIISDGKIYFYDDMNLKALDLETESISWEYKIPVYGISNLILKNNLIHLMSKERIYAIGPDGKVKWKFSIDPKLTPTILNRPVITDEIVYYSVKSEVIALSLKKGDLIWSYGAKTKNDISGTVVSDDMVYFSDLESTFYKLRGADGKKAEKYKTTMKVKSKKIDVADNIACFINSDGLLCAFMVSKP